MLKTGKQNALTDVEGLMVGSFTDRDAASGTTVILCPEGAVAGVDVRGSAPGTRETDLLEPLNLVEKAHAVVLAGGSVYGLSAADGAVFAFSRQSRLSDVQVVDAKLMPQPEGMTFMPNGDLVIASEGDKRQPARIQVFRGLGAGHR